VTSSPRTTASGLLIGGEWVDGGVMVNDTSSYHADAMPYGGVKESGYGLEGPRYAVHDMTDPRIVVLNLSAPRGAA
jgi:acyl-CoA reductase-like NAD-dependent aldehyde dehydrogenase